MFQERTSIAGHAGRPAGPPGPPGRPPARKPASPEQFRLLRRWVLRRRRGVAAALIGLAVLMFAQALQPPGAATVPVVAAAAAMPVGHLIAAGDLKIVDWPEQHQPADGFADPQEAVGRITATAIDPGEALGPNRVMSPGVLGGLAGSAESDVVAVGVRLADPGEARLLRPGDMIDLLAARGVGPTDGEHEASARTSAETVAKAVRVLAIPRPDDEGGDGVLGGRSSGSLDGGALIVLAVDESTSRRIAAASANSRLSVALLPPTASEPPTAAEPGASPQPGADTQAR